MNHFTRGAACVIGTVLLIACSSGSQPAAGARDTAPGAVSETSGRTRDSAAGTAIDPLEALLITALPSGFTKVDDSEADTGPSDLAKAAKDDGGGTNSAAILTDAGFVAGYQRAWQTADQSSVIILFLYEFATKDGATSYGDRLIGFFDSESTLKAVPFNVEGVPLAAGRSMTSLEADARLSAAVVFSKDGFLVQLVVIGPTDVENQTLVRKLSIDQLGRL